MKAKRFLSVAVLFCALCALSVFAVTADAADAELPIAHYGQSLLLKDAVRVRYYFDLQDKTLDPASGGLLLFSAEEDALTHDSAKAVYAVDGLTAEGGGYYYADSAGIAAKNMGDTQYAVGYVKAADGETVYTDVTAFSPMLYARRVCDTVSDGATEKELQLKTLVQALMQYGAAAQTYFGYNTDALMNDGFDAVAFDEAMLADRVEASAADANDIHWFGCSMVLDDALTYQFYFLVSEDAVAAANGELFFAYTVGTDETVRTVTLDANGYFYSAKVSGIAAKDMDLVVSGRVYYQSGDTTVEGPTVSYNALGYTHHILDYGTYGDTTEALAKAIAVYADAARRYWKA